MRVSWNWLSEMVELSGVGGPQGLADLLTRRGLEVEGTHSLAAGFEKVISVQILERNPHPQADRLSLCKVTTGKGEPLEIVCGAQNMKAGDKVALAQVGASLPNGMKIALSKIRGVTSNGMLCSEEELMLKEKSEGILILPPATPLGKPLAEILGRDDTVLTLKITPNRGDCMSHWGIAREVAAAIGKKAKRPTPKLLDLKGSPVSVHLEAGESGPQFWGCYIEGVTIGPSPDWVVKRLEALGSRSINNVVDATNLLLFELGQPVHAYDADRIEGKKLSIRLAREGEEIPLLDGTTVTVTHSDLVIADGKRAVGLAGVMGGGNSEVQDKTQHVFLECAEFAPSSVRRTAARYQRKTDAAQRFERGIDPLGHAHAIARLAQLVTELAGGKIKGSTNALMPSRDSKKMKPREIRMNKTFCEDFLGMPVTSKEIHKLLEAHDCEVQETEKNWIVTPPSYRLDIAIKEDLAEEVARSLGYDKIPSTVPKLSNVPTPTASEEAGLRFALLNRAKDALVQEGMMEALNFSFTSRARLQQFGMTSSVKLANPLSEEYEFMVPSLLPGLVSNSIYNWNHHFGSEPLAIRLFEFRPTFQASGKIEANSETETGVQENWKLAIALTGPRFAGGLRNERGEVDFYDLKAMVESLFDRLGTKGIRIQPMNPLGSSTYPGLFHPGQSAEILAGNQAAGVIGLLHPGKALELKTRAPLWLVELDWEAVARLSRPVTQSRPFKAWPEFPSMERDFALVVRDDISADKITQLALKAGKPLAKVAKVFDIYRGSQVAKGMTSVAVRVIFLDEGRSLQESEADAASAKILESWKKELGAELRS